MPHEAGLFVIVDGDGVIRGFGPPRADGSPPFDASCIGTSIFQVLPDLPADLLAGAIAAMAWNGRGGPRHVQVDPTDPFGLAVEVLPADGKGQVLLRWVEGLDRLSRAFVENLTEGQTLAAAVQYLAARLAPGSALGFLQAEGSGDLLLVARAGERGTAFPARWGHGLLGVLGRGGGFAGGGGGDAGLGPDEERYLAGPWLACRLGPRNGPPGALVVLRKSGDRPFLPLARAVLRSVAALTEMGLSKARFLSSLTKSVFDTVNALAVAIEAKDPYTEGHVQRVTQYALALGEELGLPEDQLQILQFAATLHDVGKIGVRAEILNKRGPLEPAEVLEIRAHPLIGEHIIADVDFLQPVRAIVRYHQERYDGSGYPEGLRGEAIPLLARIIAVADAYDSMAVDRPYRKSLGDRDAVQVLREQAGRQFDPAIVEAFLRIVDAAPGVP